MAHHHVQHHTQQKHLRFLFADAPFKTFLFLFFFVVVFFKEKADKFFTY